MKITIVGTAHPYRGGMAAFNERIAREFIAEGHEVEILTFTLQYPSFLFPGKTQYSSEPAPEGLTIRRCLNSINPFNWIKVGRAIRKSAPDVVFIKFWLPYLAPCLGTVARIARRGGKCRVVTTVDNLIPHESRPGDKMFIRYFCGSVDKFIAMSQSVMDDINRFDHKTPRVLTPHPIYDNFGDPVSREEACKRLGLDPKRKILLSFGFIRAYKGLDWLLEAFAAMKDRASAQLVIAGEFYSDGQYYHDLACRLGIDDEVVWKTEFIPDSEVRYYFSASDLIVQPYKSATQSGVTQIAYHFEKPMLVTDVGGLAEIVPDGKVGYTVEPSVGAITRAMDDFIGNNPDFSEGIRREKRKYAWSLMAEAVLS